MCESLTELCTSLARVAARFDAAPVAQLELAGLVRTAGTIEKTAATTTALAAERMAGASAQAGRTWLRGKPLRHWLAPRAHRAPGAAMSPRPSEPSPAPTEPPGSAEGRTSCEPNPGT